MSPAKKQYTFPLTIIWPGTHPEAAMPPQWVRLPDGRIKAVYQNVAELRRSVHTLLLIKLATEEFGGVIRPESEDLPD